MGWMGETELVWIGGVMSEAASCRHVDAHHHHHHHRPHRTAPYLATLGAPLVVLDLLRAVKVRHVVVQPQRLLARLALEDEVPRADLDADAQGRHLLLLHLPGVLPRLLHRQQPRRHGPQRRHGRPGRGPGLGLVVGVVGSAPPGKAGEALELYLVRLERGVVGREKEAKGAAEGRLGPQPHGHELLLVVGVVEEAEGAAAVARHEDRRLLVGLPQVLVQQELAGLVVVHQVARGVLRAVHAVGELPRAL